MAVYSDRISCDLLLLLSFSGRLVYHNFFLVKRIIDNVDEGFFFFFSFCDSVSVIHVRY